MIEKVESKIKHVEMYSQETLETIIFNRWNGSVEIAKEGQSVVINDNDVNEFLRAFKIAASFSYD